MVMEFITELDAANRQERSRLCELVKNNNPESPATIPPT